MCLILAREPEIVIPEHSIRHAVLNNPHGWGYVIPDRGKLEVRRFYDEKGTDPDDVYDVLDTHLDKKVFLHLRYATQGSKSSKNCHPFPVLQQRKDGMQVWVMHNGTESSYKENDDMSDTYHFTQKVISPLLRRVVKFSGKKGLLDDPFVSTVIEKFSGWSKWLLVDQYGQHLTVGNGVTKAGYWISNDYSFQPEYRKPAPTTTTGKKYYYSSNGYQSTRSGTITDAEYEDIEDSANPFCQASSSETDTDSGPKASVPALCHAVKQDPVTEEAPLDEGYRTTFLETCGLKDLKEMCELSEDEILDMVREYPELMTVLIQDLLWRLYNE